MDLQHLEEVSKSRAHVCLKDWYGPVLMPRQAAAVRLRKQQKWQSALFSCRLKAGVKMQSLHHEPLHHKVCGSPSMSQLQVESMGEDAVIVVGRAASVQSFPGPGLCGCEYQQQCHYCLPSPWQ